VLLQSGTVLLLFAVLWKMTRALWSSAFVAALFGIHPLHVESVAWIAERKDVLSGFFFAVILGTYVHYARAKRGYVWLIVLFALGLMCKAMLVTTPLVLLLLDYWPLRRVALGRRLFTEKLPLFCLSITSCAATLIAQSGAMEALPFAWRLKNALVTPLVYVAQMFWPVDLAPFYPFPANGPSLVQAIAASTILFVFTIAAFGFRKTRPWVIVGWCWYLVMLTPVIGIVQIGLQSHADRYTYLPEVGLYIMLVWTIMPLIRSRVLLASGAIAVLAVLGTLAFHQTRFWANSRTLWTHAAAVTHDNEVAENNLGMLDAHDGKVDSAIQHYEQAIRIQNARGAARYDLTIALAENNLATAFARKGNIDDAVAHYARAVHLRPDYADAFYNLGTLLLQQRKAVLAIDAFRAAIKTRADDAAAHASLGDALHAEGKDGEARSEYETAANLAPDAAWAIYSLAWLLATSSNESVRDGERAAQVAQRGLQVPGGESPGMLRALAAGYATQGRFADAVQVAQRALELALTRQDDASAQRLEGDLQLYRERVPLRDIATW